jgi:NAD(P) transhydrogenase subunit alpha
MTTRGKETMTSEMISNLYVFVLAGFVGFEVIRRVSPLLHTPLMALTNALDAIVVVAAIIIAGRRGTPLSTFLGAVAVAAAFSNMVGGFLITDRMVRMFKLSGRGKQQS